MRNELLEQKNTLHFQKRTISKLENSSIGQGIGRRGTDTGDEDDGISNDLTTLTTWTRLTDTWAGH